MARPRRLNRPLRLTVTLLVLASLGLAGNALAGLSQRGEASTTANGAPSPKSALRQDQPIQGTEPITVSFIGDVHFEKTLAAVARQPDGLSSLKTLLSKADITVANLETAITDGPGSPQPGKQFTFHAPSSALTTLANAGVDVVGMANNHGGDWNDAGVLDSIRAKQGAPLKVIGLGANATGANAPAVYIVDGVSIAILNASQLWEQTTQLHTATDTKAGIATITPERQPATDRFVAAVRDASARYDVVVAFLHYGTELVKCPTAKQLKAVSLLSDAGADAIIGAHSHRVQASGWTGNTYVDYGLGSFTWWMRGSDPSTGILTISVDKALVKAKRTLGEHEKSAATSVVSQEAWQAMEIGQSGLPFVPTASAVAKMNADRAGLMACSKLRATP